MAGHLRLPGGLGHRYCRSGLPGQPPCACMPGMAGWVGICSRVGQRPDVCKHAVAEGAKAGSRLLATQVRP